MTRGRKPLVFFKMMMALKPCQNWQTGKTIDEIAKEVYGDDSLPNKIKARQQINYFRRRMKILLSQNFGIKTPITIFSSKPEVSTDGEIIGRSRYFYHQKFAELDRVYKRLQDMIEGINHTQEDIVTVQKQIKIEKYQSKELQKLAETVTKKRLEKEEEV